MYSLHNIIMTDIIMTKNEKNHMLGVNFSLRAK